MSSIQMLVAFLKIWIELEFWTAVGAWIWNIIESLIWLVNKVATKMAMNNQKFKLLKKNYGFLSKSFWFWTMY